MGNGPVEQLTTVVDQLLDLDVAALDDTALHDLTITLHRIHDRLGLAASHTLAVWDQRRVWANRR